MAEQDVPHEHHGHGHGHDGWDPDAIVGKEFWDQRYRSAPAVWSGRPNPQLVERLSGVAPGTALDLGCGEGADAIWLAQQGWTVTGSDVSEVALERAADQARRVDVSDRTRWQQADLLTWRPAGADDDLVTSHFVHLPPEVRDDVHARMAEAVRVGGLLLVVAHHASDLQTTIGRPDRPELYFTPDELVRVLDPGCWEVLEADAPAREATDPAGDTVTIRDTVVLARRTA